MRKIINKIKILHFPVYSIKVQVLYSLSLYLRLYLLLNIHRYFRIEANNKKLEYHSK